LIIAEKSDRGGDLLEKLGEWVRGLAEGVFEGEVEAGYSGEGWIVLEPDEEVLMSSIRLQTRIDPIASDKPPHTARISKLWEDKILIEYPSRGGRTFRRRIPAERFAAALGYGGDDPAGFLRGVGLGEGCPVSVAADLPSSLQLRLLFEQALKGLDRLLILNAVASEVDQILSLESIKALIAGYENLTLLTHLAYLRLGVGLEKAAERLRREFEAISGRIVVRALPWRILAEAARSLRIYFPSLLE